MALTSAKLNPGDVFLYRGTGIVSRLIRLFDGSEVNHASLYLGDAVGEALANGLVRQAVQTSVAQSERVIARRLTTPVTTLDPVLARANGFLEEGHRYGYEQILLLAFLSLSRRIKAAPVLKALIRRTLDDAATWLVQLTSGGEKREPMICSEFVFRDYDEALPEANDVYALAINLATPRLVPQTRGLIPEPTRGRGIEPGSLLDLASAPRVRAAVPSLRAAPPPQSVEVLGEQYLQQVMTAPVTQRLAGSDLAELVPDVERFAQAWQQATVPTTRLMTERGALSPLEQLARAAADFVTPGDLLHTTSLFTVGDVKP